MTACPVRFAALLLALYAAPPAVHAQVVIEERAVPLAVAPPAKTASASASTFTSAVSGTLRVRYVGLNEGTYGFQSRQYVDLTTHALRSSFNGQPSSDLLSGRFEWRRRMVATFGFQGSYYDATYAQTQPPFVFTSSRRTEGYDRYEADPVFELGSVEAGVPFTLSLTYATPAAGEFPLTLTERTPPPVLARATAGATGKYEIDGEYQDCCSPAGTPLRLLRVVVEVVPQTVAVRLLRQNDAPVVEGYVMVSKVRPDWLLPTVDQPFASPFASSAAFDGLGAATDAGHFDPDTYRVEIEGADASVSLSDVRVSYTVTRGGTTAAGPLEFNAFVEGASGSTPRQIRQRKMVRFVSNGRPTTGAATDCSSWPPSNSGVSLPAGECKYDDEVAGDQTILVRLGDVVTVTAWHRPGGTSADVGLGTASFPVGQPASENGTDALRRIDLVWHEYVLANGNAVQSRPDVAAERMSEDLAQVSVFFANTGPAQPFTSADATTAVRIEVTGTGMGTISAAATLQVSVPPLTSSPLSVLVDVGDDAKRVAERIRDAIEPLIRNEVVSSPAQVLQGRQDSGIHYVVFSQVLADSLQVDPGPSQELRITPEVEDLFTPQLGSDAAVAAGISSANTDLAVLNSFVVPRVAIQRGDPNSNRLAFQTKRSVNMLFAPPDVSVGDDNVQPGTLAHEAVHALIVLDIPGISGGPECAADQADSHHPSPSNLMFCVALGQGELVGGPKRLAPAQQAQMRADQAGIGVNSLLRVP